MVHLTLDPLNLQVIKTPLTLSDMPAQPAFLTPGTTPLTDQLMAYYVTGERLASHLKVTRVPVAFNLFSRL